MSFTYGSVEAYLGWYAQLESRNGVIHNLEVAARLKIIRNMRKLRPHVEAFKQARERLIAQFSNGTGVIRPGDAGFSGYLKAERDLVESKIPDLDLEVIHADELDLEKNSIDPSALTGLGDLIKLD